MSLIFREVDLDGNIFERNYFPEEVAEVERAKIEAEQREIELQKIANAKIALLDKLGITEDEVKLLLGGN